MCPAPSISVSAASRRRLSPDACPGALTVHAAADGGLARIRVPGGALTTSGWGVLTEASRQFGDGSLQLTSRANVEIRGLALGADLELVQVLSDAGLLPSRTHERVRNIVSSPMSGLDARTRIDLSPVIIALDEAIVAAESLAGLSGRFLFGLDDGRSDIAALKPDLALAAREPGRAALLISGREVGIRIDWSDGPRMLVAAAQQFLRLSATEPGRPWRIVDLPGALEMIAAHFGGRDAGTPAPGASTPLGFIGAIDGSFCLVSAAPFGRFTAAQTSALMALAETGVRLTPWRSIVLPGLSAVQAAAAGSALRAVGLAVENSSPWQAVTACIGEPGCVKALADVRADALLSPLSNSNIRTHWSGCERRCGHPGGTYLDVLATATGYRIRTRP